MGALVGHRRSLALLLLVLGGFGTFMLNAHEQALRPLTQTPHPDAPQQARQGSGERSGLSGAPERTQSTMTIGKEEDASSPIGLEPLLTEGLVLDPSNTQGEVSRSVSVVVFHPSGEVVASLPVSGSGNFSGELHLLKPVGELRWIARDVDSYRSSFMVTRNVADGASPRGLVLSLRPTALLTARAADATGSHVPSASFLLVEMPSKTSALPTWEVESVRRVTQLVRCDRRGELRAPVRAGTASLRILGSDGTWGEERVVEVEADKAYDLGSFSVPSPTPKVHLSVVDGETGSPVTDATAVADAGEVFWSKTRGIMGAWRTNAQGVIELSPLGRSAMPFRIAVWSPWHEAQQLTITNAAEAPSIALHRKPALRISVRIEGVRSDLASVLLQRATWIVQNEQSAKRPRPIGRSALARVRHAGLYTDPVVRSGEIPGEYLCSVPNVDNYTVHVVVPGGGAASGSITAQAGSSNYVSLVIEGGRIMRLQVLDPADGTFSARDNDWRMLWVHSDGHIVSEAALPANQVPLDPRAALLWVPAQAATVELRPANPASTALEGGTSPIDVGQERITRVLIKAAQRSSSAKLQLTLRGEPLALADASIWLVPVESTEVPESGFSVRTDSRGSAQVWIPPGSYRCVSLKRFGPPRWKQVDTARGGPGDPVSIPVDP